MRAQAQATWGDPDRRRRLIRTSTIWLVVAVALGVFFALFDWDWFKGPVERIASARLHREVKIDGHLRVHPFSTRPLATVDGLRIAQPAWRTAKGGAPPPMAQVGRVTVRVKLWPLLRGRVDLPLVDIDRPRIDLYRAKDGRDNWTFGPKTDKPAALPPIESFIIRDGQLHMADTQRGLVFDGSIAASEQASGGRGFALVGKGALNHTPFLMNITGGPLIHVKRDQPYPFRAEIRAGATWINVRGRVERPFDLGQLRAGFAMSGPDLADLYGLTGVALPNTPPYRLSGQFARDGQLYAIRSFEGRVGDSDLHGKLSVTKAQGRPFLRGDIASRRLEFADLTAVFGGSPTPRQTASAGRVAGPRRILPDATLAAERVRAMDADVRYHAASVNAPGLPLKQVDLRLTLDHGVMKADPVSFTFPRGQARGNVRLDARPATPVTDLDFTVSKVALEDFVPRFQGQVPMNAELEGRARLRGAGNSVHRAAAASNGVVTVAIPAGQIRKALAELMGVNVLPGLPELLSKDPKQTELRCGVATFDVQNGVMRARSMVLDTGVVVLAGSGTVNLGDESMDITLKGKSKKPRLLRAIAPFHIGGQLAAPQFKVNPAPAIAQAGVAAALSAVLTPLAAVIPFLSGGGAKDVDCAALLTQARAAGAPVAVARASATPKS